MPVLTWEIRFCSDVSPGGPAAGAALRVRCRTLRVPVTGRADEVPRLAGCCRGRCTGRPGGRRTAAGTGSRRRSPGRPPWPESTAAPAGARPTSPPRPAGPTAPGRWRRAGGAGPVAAARPCQMRILPPWPANALRSGLPVAMVPENSRTDWANSLPNRAWVRVFQSQFGFCWTQVPSQLTAMGNGTGVLTPPAVVVAASPAREAPGSGPYHRRLPSALVAPCQILVVTIASVAVIVPHGVVVPIRVAAFQWQPAGSLMMPPVTTAAPPQALAAARGAAVEVGVAGLAGIERPGHRPAGHGHVADAAVGEVVDQRPVELAVRLQRPASGPFAGYRDAAAGARRGVAAVEGGLQRAGLHAGGPGVEDGGEVADGAAGGGGGGSGRDGAGGGRFGGGGGGRGGAGRGRREDHGRQERRGTGQAGSATAPGRVS
jgi:uncharacterized membrane protein YgcG